MNDKQVKLRTHFSNDSSNNVTTDTPLLEGEPLSNNISDWEKANDIAPEISNPEGA